MNQAEITQILIVEDNPVDVRLLRVALESVQDWITETAVAADGEEAINYLLDPKTSKPDFVILDLNLPKRDGLEVLQVIRITNNLYGLPVVVFSSSTEDVLRSKMEQAKLQAECYLTKPMGVDQFLAVGPTLRRFYEQAVDIYDRPTLQEQRFSDELTRMAKSLKRSYPNERTANPPTKDLIGAALKAVATLLMNEPNAPSPTQADAILAQIVSTL